MRFSTLSIELEKKTSDVAKEFSDLYNSVKGDRTLCKSGRRSMDSKGSS